MANNSIVSGISWGQRRDVLFVGFNESDRWQRQYQPFRIRQTGQDGQYSISKGYYDPAGNLVKTVDPEGYVTNNHYNSRNLLEAVEQIIGVKEANITRYDYDREGNLIKLEKGLNDWNDPDYSTYTYQYDSLNRLIKTMDATRQPGRQPGTVLDLLSSRIRIP